MQEILNIIKSDTFIIGFVLLNFIIFIGFMVMIIKMTRLSKRYNEFIKKLGNGKNIEEDLENYMYRVERVEKYNAELSQYCKTLNEDIANCIQKIGIVRYNAFKDTGSDLSFTLALLNDNNDGVVLNGIYSREMSNIYAKPVQEGKSKYTISQEEKQAIDQAINSKIVYKIK